ncbi:MAG TPA: ABC transporter substrate-binding protein [Thermomicrobiaceae bacterium]|nr:ABC transporter substrate-binding protein [Thermomicrobiaceae bacterium]
MGRESEQQGRKTGSAHLGVSLNRRALLRGALAAGVGGPLVGGLLAACGGGSSPATQAATTAAPAASATSAAASGTVAAGATSQPTAAGASPVATAAVAASPSAQAGTGKYTIEPAKHQGGQVIWSAPGDAKTANPVLSTDQASGFIIAPMFEGVMRADPATASPVGDLAKSWDISGDGITYSFTLNDGVTWHDGQPFSADDVKFTYDLMMNPKTKSPSTSELTERIKSLDVTDGNHFTVALKAPNAAFLASNMDSGIVPRHILKDVDPATLSQHDFSTGKKGVTIGTGPFMFEEWVKDDHVTEAKNPNYWRGEPNLAQWIFKVVPNASVLVQQLKTGEIDYGDIQPADVADMQKSGNVQVTASDSLSFVFYAYNLDTSKTDLFQDKAVRQALFYALDREAMIGAVFFGLATVAVGTMPVLSWAYNPDAITLKYPYDVNKANQLLDQAGWAKGPDGIRAKNGKRLAFELWTTSYRQPFVDITTICQQAWKKIGVDCTPKTEENTAFLTRITSTHDYAMMLVSFGWGIDPDQSSMWACGSYQSGYNMNKYCNPEVDNLLKEALATTDHAKRIALYTQSQNILMEDLPSAILFFPKRVAGVNKRVHNLYPNVIDVFFDAHQWWVDA